EREKLEKNIQNITDEPVRPSDAALSFAEQKRIQSEARTRRRKIEQLEKAIQENEEKLAHIELQMTEPDVFNDHEKINTFSIEANETKAKIDLLFEEWSELQD